MPPGETFTRDPGGIGAAADEATRPEARARATSPSGLIALVVAVAISVLRVHEGDPVPAPLHDQRRLPVGQQHQARTRPCASPASTWARSSTSSPCGKGEPGRRRDDGDRRQGPADPQATRRPRSARASSSRATSSSTCTRARPWRRRWATATRSASSRRATPVQLDQILTSLQSDTRQNLQTLLEEYRHALRPPGAAGYNALDPVLGAGLQRTRRSSTRRRSGCTPHDLSGYIRDAGTTAGALDTSPPQLQKPVTDFNRTARAFARSRTRCSRPWPSCRARCAPRARRSTRSTAPSRRCGAGRRPAARASVLRPDDRRDPAVRHARRASSFPAGAARPGRRPRADRPGARAAEHASVPLYDQVRAASSCQNEVILPVVQATRCPTRTSRPSATWPRRRRSRSPGLAGESRSGDAERLLVPRPAGAGELIYDLGNGLLATRRRCRCSAPTRPRPSSARRCGPTSPARRSPCPNLDATPGPGPQQVQSAATANPQAYQDMWDKLSTARSSELRDSRSTAPAWARTSRSSEPVTARTRRLGASWHTASAGRDRPSAQGHHAARRRRTEAASDRDPQARQRLRGDHRARRHRAGRRRLHPLQRALALPVHPVGAVHSSTPRCPPPRP